MFVVVQVSKRGNSFICREGTIREEAERCRRAYSAAERAESRRLGEPDENTFVVMAATRNLHGNWRVWKR